MAISLLSVGDLFTAAVENAIANALNASTTRFTAVGVDGQVVSATTNIALAVENDPLSGWNGTTHLWTVPSGQAGYYMIAGQCKCGTVAGIPIAAILVNATVKRYGSGPGSSSTGNGSLAVYTGALAVGDTVSLQSFNGYTMHATNGDLDNYLEIVRVGNS